MGSNLSNKLLGARTYQLNIAFLFNSDHESLSGYYGPEVMRSILSANVLQNTNRQMRVSIGDIPTYMASAGKNIKYLESLCENVYTPVNYDQLNIDELSDTYTKATVYCWLFQNMTVDVAEKLNTYLNQSNQSYLGAMDVDFSDSIHLQFFRNSLIENYRLKSGRCSIFYLMSDNEDPDQMLKEDFEDHGFTVDYEDIGARRTFFDKYDTVEHFQRVEDFREIFVKLTKSNLNTTDDVIFALEELHPKIFDTFAAAARTLIRAETEEDLAQASLSGRRVLEKLADYLFPASKKAFKGRKVGKAEYRNRLWAYIETVLDNLAVDDKETLVTLGKEADRLVELFNSGLHSDPTKEKVQNAFKDLIHWIHKVIELSPKEATKPYLAYEESMYEMFDL